MTNTVTISIHPAAVEEWNMFKRRKSGGYGISRAIMELVKEDNRRFRALREVEENE